MTGGRGAVDRRTVLRGLGALGVLGALPTLSACAAPFRDVRLTLATGGTQGVYFALGTALAVEYQQRLGLVNPPVVRSTAGSVENLLLLAAGAADIVFSQVDAAADHLQRIAPDDPRSPRALSRVYDEFVQVVVPAGSSIRTLRELRGRKVSIGARDSGVEFVARRLLRVAGISPESDLQAEYLSINESVNALRAGTVDAFFWTGGLPTSGVTELAAETPIRLLDLEAEDLLKDVRDAFPVYAPGTVPAAMYGLTTPIKTVLVRNFLIVPADMPSDLAYALVETVFAAQERLARASPAALTIDLRAAIGTQPVALHPGAERYFREAKKS
ncbi:TAXI family TRAP transporter solute-binding subunit [Actinomycetes bacterium KLBMP 9759]